MIGQTFSHYRIIKEIGKGGMGVVYLAEDTVLGRQVAIKTLTEVNGAGNQNFRTRFLREARAVSALSHPHIATIHDYGETPEGQPYIVMEFIRGETLADLILKESLTIPRALEIIGEVAEALGEAHAHGIIHRDIKPSNIAINHRGEVKVLDFGLAKQIDPGIADSFDPERQTLLNTQTREGVIVGTPMYLSPEQALGLEVDARSDLFSLGGVLYECLAGKPPFFGGSPMEICAKVIRDDPPPPSQVNSDVPPELDRIVLKALGKKPDQRYQTAGELFADLTSARPEVHGFDQTVTRTINAPQRTQPTGALATLSDIFKRPRLSVGYVAAGLIITAALGFGIWRVNRPTPHEPTTEAKQLYDKGVGALQEGTYYKASKLLERAVAADSKFMLAHARLAEALTELDYHDKAKDEMLAANRLVTDRSVLEHLEGLYFDAINATVTRDLTGAIKAYEDITRLKSFDNPSLLDLGRAYENNDELAKAIASYQRASETDRNSPVALLRLGILYGRQQDLTKADATFDQADSLYKDSDNFEGNSEVSFQRGFLLNQLSKVPEARIQAQKSLDIAKFADNKYQQVRALLLLGSVAYSSGDTAQGEQLVHQALDLARNNDMETLATQGLLDLGYALMIKRSYDESERYLKQGFELAQRYKEKRNEARAKLLLGTLYIQKEDADKGGPFIDQALTFYRSGGYRREISRSMMMVGRQQLLKGDFDGAVKTLDEQLKLAKQVEDPGQLARSQAEVAAALSKQDFYPQALIRFTESYELNKFLDNSLNTAFALLNRGDMLARLGRYNEANQALDQLMPLLEKISSDNKYRAIWTAWSYLIRAQMALSERDYAEAKAKSREALAVMTGNNRSTNTEASIKSNLCLTEVLSGSLAGLKLCQEAVALVSSADHADADTTLALAEALLETRKPQEALEAALVSQWEFANRHRDESEWRAWLIAAQANQKLQQTEPIRDQVSRARALLEGLRAKWSGNSFDFYTARADVRLKRQQIDTLSNSAR
jgi:eukaryotic-like serine/threonine-protein kinase